MIEGRNLSTASRFLDFRGVMRITGLSKSSIYRIKELKPVRIGERRTLWLAAEVEAYVQSRIAERDAA